MSDRIEARRGLEKWDCPPFHNFQKPLTRGTLLSRAGHGARIGYADRAVVLAECHLHAIPGQLLEQSMAIIPVLP